LRNCGGEIPAAVSSVGVNSDFRRLAAHERAIALSVELHRAMAAWPSFERWSIGIQLVRAINSVGANIAEASGRRHKREKQQFLGYAWGSLLEVEHFLVIAESLDLVAKGSADRLDDVARPLNGLIMKCGGR
jgi:four helix bundle protein